MSSGATYLVSELPADLAPLLPSKAQDPRPSPQPHRSPDDGCRRTSTKQLVPKAEKRDKNINGAVKKIMQIFPPKQKT